jgi:hypothetical protein
LYSITFLLHGKFCEPVTPLHWIPLQNVTISNTKNDNCKALQKTAKSDSFVTDNALHAQHWKLVYGNSKKKKSASFTVSTRVLLLATIYEAHYLMLIARLENRNIELSSLLFLKMYEAHYLTLIAGPNQTTKGKTLSRKYLIRSA